VHKNAALRSMLRQLLQHHRVTILHITPTTAQYHDIHNKLAIASLKGVSTTLIFVSKIPE